MSKDCPDRKYKGGSKSGKDKGKYKKKGKRFGKGRHIQATNMDDVSEEEEEVKESHQSEEQLIHTLKKLPKDQQINMLVNIEQDFQQWGV